ncbi:hypothetical protein VSH64_24975 [Amycolatopsis rhabdoformis]|uniref:DUF4314 domain-containing protein n=1 Tax=Amycolatopsis rhabdoformis TaxID=1448059 RepID=A0ABZ1HX56_9PSEU|nr:hypothetical protein [Amycolatopsis rhabdoformis]WSE26132.1 hypothetical protein VSH64_24975 [Amycolatopsis rhabdoformis]
MSGIDRKSVSTENLKVGDLVTDAPEGCRITSIEEMPGPLLVTWDDGQSEIYDRDIQWELVNGEI